MRGGDLARDHPAFRHADQHQLHGGIVALERQHVADIGGAPANAIDEVKSVADIVLTTSNNESCVAEFLQRALGIESKS